MQRFYFNLLITLKFIVTGGAKDRKKRTQIFFGPESSRLLLEKVFKNNNL